MAACMDKGIMGKSFNNNTLGIAAVVLVIGILLGVREAYPAYGEAELFDLGYEHYLSAQPGKAVEAFTLFLEAFPQSSARDAAMFWLAKSLIQLMRDQDARNMFDRITREFPESPLKPYAVKENEGLGASGATREDEAFPGGIYGGVESPEKRPEEGGKTTQLLENGTTEEGTPKSVAQEEKDDLEGTHTGMIRREEKVVTGGSAESPALPISRPSYTAQVSLLNSEVNAFIDQYTQAYELGDVDKFMSFYSRSAIENNTAGYNEIRNGYAKNFRVSRYAYSLKDTLMEESDGNVILAGTYVITRIQGNPLGIITQGHIRWMLRKEDGVLKIIRADYDQL